ncbi:hypothetical protein [Parvibaculum sp.]|uniref:hypothetical protein n=1 Tax=Parvibaculum sp. TaxID=2024848 RepID=UPI0034A02CC5
MTIAACYISPEGVVLGADSTASINTATDGFHYFNHTQKLFEIGEQSNLGVVTWGLGGLGTTSYRSLFAELADDLSTNPPNDMADVGARWVAKFWGAYTQSADLAPLIAKCKQLAAKPAFDANAVAPDPLARTKLEENSFLQLNQNLFVGFCIGGMVLPDRTPSALCIEFDPLSNAPPVATSLGINTRWFWGAPNIFHRLITGADPNFLDSIAHSQFWTGTDQDLVSLVQQHQFGHPILPIREAIDFVHVCIYSTIKALKFSNFSQTCGGPIELAVITTDRPFRWVRHKEWDTAIDDGVPL